MTATTPPTNLLLRNDTILGVCEALGQDFGINPLWLRVAFCAPIYWNPALVIGVYLAIGVVVAATRFALPDRYAQAEVPAPVAATPAIAARTPQVEQDRELIAA